MGFGDLYGNLRNPMGLTYMLTELDNGKTHIGNKGNSITVDAGINTVVTSWMKWISGEYIQNAFPYLPAEQREFLMTGITPEEWKELFGEDDA